MQLNVQSSFGRARGLLRCLICRGLPECLSVPSLAELSFFSINSRDRLRHALSISKRSATDPAMAVSQPSQGGFTLIELLVVISLVGLLAIGIVVSLDGVDDDARERLTKAEMGELRKALLQFRRDIGHFPGVDSPFPPAEDEVLDLLRDCQSDDEPEDADDDASLTYDPGCRPYNIDTARGWNGPYALPERMDDPVRTGYFDAWGNPYRLYDQGDAVPGSGMARIVSFGPDGQDGLAGSPNSDATDCNPIAGSDDIVLCLVQ